MDETAGTDERRLRAVFAALGEHGVDHAVFGAVALGLHGLARATADLDLFMAPEPQNVERLKAALMAVYAEPRLDEITVSDLCGDHPAVRYHPDDGFSLDVVTRPGEAVRHADLEVETKDFDGVAVRVMSPRTPWRLNKDTVRPLDRIDAAALARRFGLEEA